MITQTEFEDGRKVTSIQVGRGSKEWGERIKAKLDGTSYMDFEIIVAPDCGEFAVTAQTWYDAEPDEIMDMFVYLMAIEVGRE